MTDDLSAAPPTSVRDRVLAVPMPPRIAALPRDRRGFPVPRFVVWIEGDPSDPANVRPPGQGEPHFAIMDPAHLATCIRRRVCWICGQPLGRSLTFVIGPMCAINRISSEPPSHHDCGHYAVQACPFLAIPQMRRLPTHPYGGVTHAAGFPARHNPGAGMLWTTRSYRAVRSYAGGDGVLFRIGPPEKVEWFAEGREAKPDEIHAALAAGLRILSKAAAEEGPDAVIELRKWVMALPSEMLVLLARGPLDGTEGAL